MTTTQIVAGVFGLALVILLGGSVLVSSVVASARGMHSPQDVKSHAVRVRAGIVRSRECAGALGQIASSAGKVPAAPATVRARTATASRPVRRTVGSEQVFAPSGSARRIALASLSRRGDQSE